MFRKVSSFLVLILVGLIPPLIIYFIQRQTPEIRYTLSERIPVTFLNSDNSAQEVVQQIDVKNIGNDTGYKILVRIRGKLSAYELQKYAFSDSAQFSFDNEESFELIYPELPPQGSFKLIFKSPGNGIQYSDLQIAHSRGLGYEALSSQPNNTIFNVVFYSFTGLYVLFLLFNIRGTLLDTWKNGVVYKTTDEVMKLHRPVYAIDKDWSALHLDVLKSYLNNNVSYYHDLKSSGSYRFFNYHKPNHFSPQQWEELVGYAITKLSDNYDKVLSEGASKQRVLNLLQTERPTNFPTNKWNELQEKASKFYVFLDMKTAYIYSIDHVVNELEKKKPDEVWEGHWKERVKYYQDYYLYLLFAKASRSDNPENMLDNESLKWLNLDDQKKVFDFVNKVLRIEILKDLFFKIIDGQEIDGQKPEELATYEWDLILEIEESIKSSDDQRKKAQTILEIWDKIQNNGDFQEEKPIFLSDYEWTRLEEMRDAYKKFKAVEQKEAAIQNKSSKIDKAEERLSLQKASLVRKLEMLHSILSDPTSIDRMEDLDELFAPGNAENLRKISKILTKRDVI